MGVATRGEEKLSNDKLESSKIILVTYCLGGYILMYNLYTNANHHANWVRILALRKCCPHISVSPFLGLGFRRLL